MVESTAIGADSCDEGHRLGALTPSQILYLEQDNQRLYVELIQILRDRDMGWLRPLCLCSPISHQTQNQAQPQPSEPSLPNPEANTTALSTDRHAYKTIHVSCDGISFALHDMRQSSDLLWPLTQCNVVLDLDAIPILSGLGPEPTPLANRDRARQALNTFMRKMWHEATD